MNNVQYISKIIEETRTETLNVVKQELEPILKKEVKSIKKEMNENNIILQNKIEEVKKIATKNKQYSKSILAKLNEEHKDNPPLEYPGDFEALTALHTHYNLTPEQLLKTNKLQKAIIKDFKNGVLVNVIIKILTEFLKKDNIYLQSIFNTDSARNNYAAKLKDEWLADKAGLYLNNKVIKPFCTIIKTLMEKFIKYKYDRSAFVRKQMIEKNTKVDNAYSDNDEDDDASVDSNQFTDKDDASDEERKYLAELEQLCDIRELIKYIDTKRLYQEIITRLAPILNYNIRIKTLS